MHEQVDDPFGLEGKVRQRREPGDPPRWWGEGLASTSAPRNLLLGRRLPEAAKAQGTPPPGGRTRRRLEGNRKMGEGSVKLRGDITAFRK